MEHKSVSQRILLFYLFRGWVEIFFLKRFSFLLVSVSMLFAAVAISPPADGAQTLTTLVPTDLGDGGSVTDAWLGGLKDLVIDDEGNLYFPDITFSVVRKVTPSGQVIRIAGTGVEGDSGDGGPATFAQLSWPFSLVLDPEGILYISNLGNNRVRAVNLTKHTVHILGKIKIKSGEIATVAGNNPQFGFSGDGGPAIAAQLAGPRGLAFHADSLREPLSLYISDIDNNRIGRVDGKTGIITTVAGTGFFPGQIDGPGGDPCDDVGDGGPPTHAAVDFPTGVAFDSFGNLFILEFRGRICDVREGIISTIAGAGG